MLCFLVLDLLILIIKWKKKTNNDSIGASEIAFLLLRTSKVVILYFYY